MLDFIERLRQKPEPVRRRFVFLVAASVTGVIFLIWLSIVGMRFIDIIGPDSDIRRATDATFEDIDTTVKNAIEKSKTEYEVFQQEFQNTTDTVPTTTTTTTTVREINE